MRGLRSFLVLLLLLIGLGSYVYFVESRREPGDDRKQEKVFAVKADEIGEITVKSESGERTTLRKTGDDWQIVSPATLAPDGMEASGLASNLSNLEVQRVIDENPADLAEYGLATPRVEVAFKAGGEERRLLIGRKTPPGTDLYAKLADSPRVFLISSYLDSTFNRTTFDLRDKSVLDVDRDKIDSISVAAGANTLRLRKQDADWRLSAPTDGRADFTAVEGLVNRLDTLQMKSVAAADAKALAEYGLDKPAATVQIGAGSSQATLLVGKSAGEGVVFAKDGSRPAVVTVDASLLDELKKGADEYRQKDLFDARSFTATRLEMVRMGAPLTFEKTKVKNKDGQEEEKWRQTAPAAQEVDQTKIENLLSAVTQTRASSFVDARTKTGLEKAELVATVTSGEGKRETVRFARTGGDAFATREGDPGVAKIEASTLDNIIKALDEVQKPAAKPQE